MTSEMDTPVYLWNVSCFDGGRVVSHYCNPMQQHANGFRALLMVFIDKYFLIPLDI